MRLARLILCLALFPLAACDATTGAEPAASTPPPVTQGEAGAPPATTSTDQTPPSAEPAAHGSRDAMTDTPEATPPEAGAPTADTALDSAATVKDGTAEAGTPAPAPTGAPGEVDYSCKTDADCAVKDVGNCCGYYPACVNANSPTFPDQVKAQCSAQGMSSVCGFQEISACQCVDNRCAAADGGAEK